MIFTFPPLFTFSFFTNFMIFGTINSQPPLFTLVYHQILSLKMVRAYVPNSFRLKIWYYHGYRYYSWVRTHEGDCDGDSGVSQNGIHTLAIWLSKTCTQLA